MGEGGQHFGILENNAKVVFTGEILLKLVSTLEIDHILLKNSPKDNIFCKLARIP